MFFRNPWKESTGFAVPRMAIEKSLFKTLSIIAVSLLSSVEAAALTLDLDHCTEPDPEGKAYIAVGTTVLRLPIRELLVVDDPPSWVRTPQPPRSDEPHGCKGNPLPQTTLIQAFQFDAWRANTTRSSPLTQLRLIGDLPKYVGLHLDKAHTESCRVLLGRVKLESGMEGCTPAKNDLEQSAVGVGSYQAPHSLYPLPFGQLFTASCIPSAGATQVKCTVSYRLTKNLALTYQFKTTDLPLEQLIDFDRQLSAAIKASIVPDYPWTQWTEK